MANQQKPVGIPEPTNDPDSLWRTTQALKEAVEILQGTRGNRAAALKSDLTDSVVELTQISGGSGLNNIVEDLTPQLGGTLDTNNNHIKLNNLQSLYFYDNAGTQECFRVYNFGASTYGNHNFLSQDGQSRCSFTNNPSGEFHLNRNTGNTAFRISGFSSVIISGVGTTEFVAKNYNFDIDQTVGATEQNYALIYDDVGGQISLQAVGSNILADGSVTLTKFSDGLEPVSIVTSLPTLPDSNYPDNSVVVLTTDSLLYRNSGGTWVKVVRSVDLDGTIDLGSQISGTLTSAFAEAGLINSNVTINADGTLSGAGGGQASLNSLPGTIQLASYAAAQRPVIIVGALPTLPDSDYPIGSTVVLTTDGKLYRNDSNVWTAAVPTADLSGTINLGTQVSGTLTSAFAEAGLINANVTINADGSLSGAGGGQATLNSLTGQISAAQIAANTITAGQIAANTITASQIAANTITSSEIVSNTITAGEIAANTITASEIATNTITAAEIAAGAINADELAVNAVTADKIAANAVTAGKINALAVTAGTIAAGVVDTTELAADAVTADKIAANTITAGEIAANTITAGQIAAGTITAAELAATITYTKTLVISTNGLIRGGQTGYNTGTGFFLGYDTSTYKFSIGDGGTSNFMTWDGSELVVRGNVSIGNYTASTTEVLLAANTQRNSSSLTYTEVKKFNVNKPGTIRVYFTARLTSISGGLVTSGGVRVKRDGSVQFTQPISSTTAQTYSTQVTTTENTNYITLEYKSGERNTLEPTATPTILTLAEIRAVVDLGESVITD
jgi:hypothetical protein